MKHTYHSIAALLTRYSIPILITLSLSAAFALLYPSILSVLLMQRGVDSLTEGKTERAEQLFHHAAAYHQNAVAVANANLGLIAYQNNEYARAHDLFMQAFVRECAPFLEKDTKPYRDERCGVIAYDMGNVLYRLGEHATSTDKRQQDWIKAISWYQTALRANPDDTQAQDNIDFILNKLRKQQEEEQNNKDTQRQNNRNGKGGQNDSDDTANAGKQNASDKETATQKQTGNANETGGTEKQEKTGGSAAGKGGQKQLPPRASKQLDAYMRQLEQQNRELKSYFHQNPEANARNNPFGDPFFNVFFNGSPLERSFENRSVQPEKDW